MKSVTHVREEVPVILVRASPLGRAESWVGRAELGSPRNSEK